MMTSPRTDDLDCLPPRMRASQAAIELPEVQAMMRKLGQHGLGVFMPHMHDEETGRFIELPADTISVEDGLSVSFATDEELAATGKTYVNVAWEWIDDGIRAMATCRAKCVTQGSQHTTSTHPPKD